MSYPFSGHPYAFNHAGPPPMMPPFPMPQVHPFAQSGAPPVPPRPHAQGSVDPHHWQPNPQATPGYHYEAQPRSHTAWTEPINPMTMEPEHYAPRPIPNPRKASPPPRYRSPELRPHATTPPRREGSDVTMDDADNDSLDRALSTLLRCLDARGLSSGDQKLLDTLIRSKDPRKGWTVPIHPPFWDFVRGAVDSQSSGVPFEQALLAQAQYIISNTNTNTNHASESHPASSSGHPGSAPRAGMTGSSHSVPATENQPMPHDKLEEMHKRLNDLHSSFVLPAVLEFDLSRTRAQILNGEPALKYGSSINRPAQQYEAALNKMVLDSDSLDGSNGQRKQLVTAIQAALTHLDEHVRAMQTAYIRDHLEALAVSFTEAQSAFVLPPVVRFTSSPSAICGLAEVGASGAVVAYLKDTQALVQQLQSITIALNVNEDRRVELLQLVEKEVEDLEEELRRRRENPDSMQPASAAFLAQLAQFAAVLEVPFKLPTRLDFTSTPVDTIYRPLRLAEVPVNEETIKRHRVLDRFQPEVMDTLATNGIADARWKRKRVTQQIVQARRDIERHVEQMRVEGRSG